MHPVGSVPSTKHFHTTNCASFLCTNATSERGPGAWYTDVLKELTVYWDSHINSTNWVLWQGHGQVTVRILWRHGLSFNEAHEMYYQWLEVFKPAGGWESGGKPQLIPFPWLTGTGLLYAPELSGGQAMCQGSLLHPCFPSVEFSWLWSVAQWKGPMGSISLEKYPLLMYGTHKSLCLHTYAELIWHSQEILLRKISWLGSHHLHLTVAAIPHGWITGLWSLYSCFRDAVYALIAVLVHELLFTGGGSSSQVLCS